jgi:uncharacterized protein
MAIITDLDFIAGQAVILQDDNDAFRYYVEDDECSDEELDRLVEAIAAPIIAAINCQECANCCRNLDVYLTSDDAERLSKGLLIPLAAVEDRYIDHHRAEAEGEWGVFKAKPCVFLAGKSCSIYEHRPESCRAYPEFTPDFRWQLGHILEGAGLCPIIYNVMEAMKHELKW